MVADIKNKYNEIEQDLINNQQDVFLRYNYYTKKYKGNRLNDFNVGLFLNDNLQPVAQIFVRYKTCCIKTHLIFNKAGNSVINKIELINEEYLQFPKLNNNE